MPRSTWDDDEDEFDFSNDPAANTPLVKQLRKQLKEAQKAATDWEQKASKADAANRQRVVADVLKDKGASPALARYALADLKETGVEPTPEAVASWLTENGELFGYKPQPQADPAQAFGLPAGTELPPDLVAAYQQFVNGQTNTGGHTDPVDSKLAAVQSAKSAEELLALIAAG